MSLQIDHDVGLIQNEDLDPFDVEGLETEQPVDELARSADQNVLDQFASRPQLALRDVADGDAGELTHLARHFRGLHGQLERRTEDQHLRVVQRFVNTLETRDQEGRRFAGARLRLGDCIMMRTGHQQRENGLLDATWLLEAHRIDAQLELLRNAEVFERLRRVERRLGVVAHDFELFVALNYGVPKHLVQVAELSLVRDLEWERSSISITRKPRWANST